MTAVLPTNVNEDTIPVFLAKQLGTPLVGDQQLHLLAGEATAMPLIAATINTNATTAGLSGGDATTLVTAIKKLKGAK